MEGITQLVPKRRHKTGRRPGPTTPELAAKMQDPSQDQQQEHPTK